jgi:hypothetical protein
MLTIHSAALKIQPVLAAAGDMDNDSVKLVIGIAVLIGCVIVGMMNK